MSVLYVCDNCGKQGIKRSYVGDRLKTKVGKIETETMVAIDGVWNSGHLCYECLVAHLFVVTGAGEHSGAQEITDGYQRGFDDGVRALSDQVQERLSDEIDSPDARWRTFRGPDLFPPKTTLAPSPTPGERA